MLKQALTLEALEVLDAIDQKGSFASAANILYKVPSAITYTVQKLEQDLGVALFTKQGRKSVLTPAGKVLLQQGREILEAAERLTEQTRQIANGWESYLNIAIDTCLGSEIIYPQLAELFKLQPDIQINLHQEALAGSWEALLENRADLSIGLPRKPGGASGFCCLPYQKSHWIFAVHPSHPLVSLKQPLKKQDIECHRTVVVRDSSRNHAKMTHRLFSKHPVLSVQSVTDKITAQKSGLGIGYLPKFKIEQELALGELVELEVEGVSQQETLYIGWRRENKGKALKWLIEKLKQKQ